MQQLKGHFTQIIKHKLFFLIIIGSISSPGGGRCLKTRMNKTKTTKREEKNVFICHLGEVAFYIWVWIACIKPSAVWVIWNWRQKKWCQRIFTHPHSSLHHDPQISQKSTFSRLAGACFVDVYPSSTFPIILQPSLPFLASNHKSAFITSPLFPLRLLLIFIPPLPFSLSTSTCSILPSFHPSTPAIISHLYYPEKPLFLPSSVVNCLSSPVIPLSFLLFLFLDVTFFLSFLAKPPPLVVWLSLSLLPSEGLKTFLLHCWFWFCKILITRIMLIIFLLWHNLVCPDLRKRYSKLEKEKCCCFCSYVCKKLFISCLFYIIFYYIVVVVVFVWLHKSTLDVSQRSVFSALSRLLIGPGVSRDQMQPSHHVG